MHNINLTHWAKLREPKGLEPLRQVHRPDQLLMPGNGETVGHSGDEIADPAQARGFAFATLPAGREILRIVAVAAGKVADDPLRLDPDRA